MRRSNRRKFLGQVGGSVAMLVVPARSSPAEASADRERLAAALRQLNEAAGIGITADEFERARGYATGVHLEAQAKLRPMVLRGDLDLPVHFSARRKP